MSNNSETQDVAKLDQCIDEIIKREGYVSCDIEKKLITTDGGNFVGNLYEIDLKGKTEDGPKESYLFVKAKTLDAVDMEVMSLDDVYVKELFIYVELSKVFDELQNEANVPISERFRMVKGYDESYPDAIVLENITKIGFKTWFRMDCSSLHMAEMCIVQLAKFHALSFVIKDRRPDYFEGKIKSLDIPIFFEKKAWDEFNDKFYNVSMEYLNEKMKKKVEDKITALLKKHAQMFTDEAWRCCLCHGDYRLNNVMFKEQDGKIIEVIPVDYQLIHYGNPIFDLFLFMYTGTDYTFRRNHMTNLKNLYYETMETFLKHFNISIEEAMPRERFEQMYTKMLEYGLIVSVLYLPFIYVSEGEAPDLSKECVENLNFPLDDRFRDRFVGAIQEFIDMGYL